MSTNAFADANYEEGMFDFGALHRRIKAKMKSASSKPSDTAIQINNNQVYVEASLDQPLESSIKVTTLDWTDMVTTGNRYIGGGGSGNVFLAEFTNLSTGDSQSIPPVVMKKFTVLWDMQESKQYIKRVLREILRCSILKHENIVPIIGFCHYKNECPCLLSEYMMNGPVNAYIAKNPQACLHAIALGIATGLSYLHGGIDENVVHGDLKAENILINKRGLPCLCDIGVSNILMPVTVWDTSADEGTARWQAPEQLLVNGMRATKESDVYSYGMTCYEIVTNQVPFYKWKSNMLVWAHIAFDKGTLQRPNCIWVTDFIWDLLTKCWSFEPSERPLVSDICSYLSPHSCRDNQSQCLFRSDTAMLENQSSPANSLRIDDFDGSEILIPLPECRTWQNLCKSLELHFKDKTRQRFISSQKFGLLAPNDHSLLSKDSWETRIGEDENHSNIIFKLFAIVDDDSGCCPHCKQPLSTTSPTDNNQECPSCGQMFRVVYQDPEVEVNREGQQFIQNWRDIAAPTTVNISSEPGLPLQTQTRAEGGTEAPVSSAALDTDAPGIQSIQGSSSESELFNHPGSRPMTGLHPETSLPKNVQVIRRRQPFTRVEETGSSDERAQNLQSSLTTLYPPTASGDPPPKRLPSRSGLALAYMIVMFRLPERYIRLTRNHEHYNRSLPSFNQSQAVVYKSLLREWGQMATVAGIFFGVLFTSLQINSAAYDPLTRILIELSITCFFFSTTYSIILRMSFATMEIEDSNRNCLNMMVVLRDGAYWNPSIMLAIPLVWMLWGLLYFFCFFVIFIWRSGATNEPNESTRLSPKQSYGPRIAITLVIVIGMIYLVLIILSVRKMERERNSIKESAGR